MLFCKMFCGSYQLFETSKATRDISKICVISFLFTATAQVHIYPLSAVCLLLSSRSRRICSPMMYIEGTIKNHTFNVTSMLIGSLDQFAPVFKPSGLILLPLIETLFALLKSLLGFFLLYSIFSIQALSSLFF